MADEQLIALKPTTWELLSRLLRDYKRGLLGGSGGSSRASSEAGPASVVLLEPLASLGSARAFKLIPSDATATWMLTIIGSLSEFDALQPLLQLTVNGVPAPLLSPLATGPQVKAALIATGQLAEGEITIRLGNTAEFQPLRWFIELNYDRTPERTEIIIQASGLWQLAQAKIEQTPMTCSTIEIPVNSIIPVGHPSPMNAGVIAMTNWIPGIGQSITSVEPRWFQEVGYFDE